MAAMSEVSRRMLLVSAGATAVGPGSVRRRVAGSSRSGSRDFEFLIGRWDVVHQRRLRTAAAVPCWERFKSRCVVTPILGGVGQIDDHALDRSSGENHLATLRLYDPREDLWSIRSMVGRSPTLAEPAHGRFLDGVGVFYGAEVVGGELAKVRLTWSSLTRRTATWTRACRTDGGPGWETDWIMQYLRRS
jgi:hypothetical protein